MSRLAEGTMEARRNVGIVGVAGVQCCCYPRCCCCFIVAAVVMWAHEEIEIDVFVVLFPELGLGFVCVLFICLVL